jgi:type VI secretion system protein ImpL
LQQQWQNLQVFLLPMLTDPDRGEAALAYISHSPIPDDALQLLQHQVTNLPIPLSLWIESLTSRSQQLLQRRALEALERHWQQDLWQGFQQHLAERYPFNPVATQEVALGDMEQFFAADGVFASFIQKWGQTEIWRRQPDAARLEQQVQQIRHLLFNAQGKLEMHFALQPVELSPDQRRSLLDLDGQLIDYRHGAREPVPLIWPNAGQNGSLSRLTLYPVDTDLPSRFLSQNGAWSLFRLMQQAHIRQTDDGEQLEFRFGHGQMRYLLPASGAENPFAAGLFATFKLPEKLE